MKSKCYFKPREWISRHKKSRSSEDRVKDEPWGSALVIMLGNLRVPEKKQNRGFRAESCRKTIAWNLS